MAQYNSLNIKLSNLQLKLNSAIKNKAEIVLRSSNTNGSSDDKTSFSHELLLTNKKIFVRLL